MDAKDLIIQLGKVEAQISDAARELKDAPPEKQAMFQKFYDDLVRKEERLDNLWALILTKPPGIAQASFCCLPPQALHPHTAYYIFHTTVAY